MRGYVAEMQQMQPPTWRNSKKMAILLHKLQCSKEVLVGDGVQLQKVQQKHNQIPGMRNCENENIQQIGMRSGWMADCSENIDRLRKAATQLES